MTGHKLPPARAAALKPSSVTRLVPAKSWMSLFPISKEAVPPQICRLSTDTARWYSILCLVCTSHSSMWLAKSFGNQCSIITTTKAEGKTDRSAMKPLITKWTIIAKKEHWFIAPSHSFVSVCLSQLEMSTQFAASCFFLLMLIRKESETADCAQISSHIFIFTKRQEGKNEGEMERQRADSTWSEGIQDREQPITTLKICWKEFQEVGPPLWGRGKQEFVG